MRPEIIYDGKQCINLISNDDHTFTVVYRNGRRATIVGLPKGKIGMPRDLTVCVKVDPRYYHTQNREPLEIKPEYRGEPETWTL